MTEENGFKVTDRRVRVDEEGQAQAPEGEAAGPSKEQEAHAEKAFEEAVKDQHAGPMYPQVTFSTFILSLSSSAMVHLGEVPEPETGQTMENLPLAKHTIDILAMLKDKTSRCLDADEARLLEGLLYELRMKYVMKAQ
jgi:hypothetical protein